MSAKTLGLPFDIHGGGVDLTFPHHENEIAQGCCLVAEQRNPQAYARYWFHNGFVTVEGEKMSKSLGNVVLVHDLIKEVPGETLRLALLSTHYRQPLDWTNTLIEQSGKLLDKLYRLVLESEESLDLKGTPIPETILNALLDDLNTAKAISQITILAGEATRTKDKIERQFLTAGIVNGARLLGLLNNEPKEWFGYGLSADSAQSQYIEELIQERAQARISRDFKRADAVRDQLREQGIELEDTATGTIWRKI
jgi:cysteinyl-tRNA synthetase